MGNVRCYKQLQGSPHAFADDRKRYQIFRDADETHSEEARSLCQTWKQMRRANVQAECPHILSDVGKQEERGHPYG